MPQPAQCPIPVTLLTGFLGSGKTTLINRALQEAQMADTLVIINEFGQTALDHHLVAHSQENVIEAMGSGCLCCTIRRDLVQTLRDIIWRFSRAGQRQFHRVLIETTGLANPAPILHTLLNEPQLAGKYTPDGVVTVVDLENGLATLARHGEAQRQVAVADLLLLSKRDRVDAAQEHTLRQRLSELNLLAVQQVLSSTQPLAPFLLGLGAQTEQKRAWSLEAFEPSEQHADHNHNHNHNHNHSYSVNDDQDQVQFQGHGHPAGEAHDLNRHSPSIRACSVVLSQPLGAEPLQAWLLALCQWAGERLLRLKAVLAVQGMAQPQIIHAVQHQLYPWQSAPQWSWPDQQGRMVLITQDIDADELWVRLQRLDAAVCRVSE